MRNALVLATFLCAGAASASGGTDLVVTVESNASTKVHEGQVIGFTVMAANAGPTAAVGARVHAVFPAMMDGVTWTCEASPGVACPASGSGDVDLVLDIPVGGVAVFTGTGAAMDVGVATATATVSAGAGQSDVDPTNNEMSADTSVAAAPALPGEVTPSYAGCAVGGQGGSCLGLLLVGLFVLRTSRRS